MQAKRFGEKRNSSHRTHGPGREEAVRVVKLGGRCWERFTDGFWPGFGLYFLKLIGEFFLAAHRSLFALSGDKSRSAQCALHQKF